MKEIVIGMIEYVCDNICKHPGNCSEEELDEICCDCKMGGYVCKILNTAEER